ncbi:unnamed protein product [Rotaria magnacalcarata]|nr:unnamed protein product [Rotaria magnacalcarata]
MNAAFGLEQLKKLPSFLEIRRKNINQFVKQLKELIPYGLVLPKDHDKLDWLALPLMLPNRKELLQNLEDNNIQTRVCFAGNITRHPAYRQFYEVFPNADEIMKNGFLIGAHHGMSEQDVDYVCKTIKMHVYSSQPSNNINTQS